MNYDLNIESLSDTSDISTKSDVSELLEEIEEIEEIDNKTLYMKYNIDEEDLEDDLEEDLEEVNLENNNENDTDTDTDIDIETDSRQIQNNYLYYNEMQDIQDEICSFNYHLLKNTGDWLLAKHIVSYSNNKTNTEFFWDYLDLLFKESNDKFENITKIIYSSNETVFEFDTNISKYIVDNLKISKYKTNGYIFNSTDNNVWNFKIVVITSKNIYAVNRYIDENKIGCY